MSDPDADATDLDTLFPERTLTVAGQPVTVHELTFIQSLHLHASLAPVLEALAPHYGAEGIGSDTVIGALAQHPQVACALLAAATRQSEEWIAALPEHDGYLLLLTFVAIHIPFFATRLELARQMAQALGRVMAATLAKSSRGSSATDTTTRQ